MPWNTWLRTAEGASSRAKAITPSSRHGEQLHAAGTRLFTVSLASAARPTTWRSWSRGSPGGTPGTPPLPDA
jgi:hypothetical protein